METQSQEIFSSFEKKKTTPQIEISGRTALISIVSGSGISEISKELGVDLVIDGGLDMNPSVADIVSSVNQIRAGSILLLTNDINVIPAANQASELLSSEVVIMPTETQAEGLECIVDFDPDRSASQNKEIMDELIPQIKTISMFKSSRAVEIKGIKVDRLQPIAMVEGSIHSYADSLEDLFLKVIREELNKGTEHVTVLLGNGMGAEDIGEIENLLNRNIENFQEDIIELHVGGQPYYDYLISVLSD